jgi:membrane protease YdiL (CAAX protease family)
VRILVPALFLCAILALFCTSLQAALRRWVQGGRARVFVAPAALCAVFCALLWRSGILSVAPAVLIVVYTFAPTAIAYATRSNFPIILLLWLPLEFAVGAKAIPNPLQGFFHTVAYGIAILLALWLFLIFRNLPGLKYNPPRGVRDWVTPLIGYAIVAPILIPIGLWLRFIQPFHVPPHLTAGFVLSRFLVILAATAIPEEILFRSLIQNCIMQRLGFTNRALLLAAVIFGCAHLNNGPGPLPNWRYAIMATIAGFAYGKVFQKSSTVLSSATLHALINTSKHIFF